MALDLADYVDTLRREVTPPGSTTFNTVSDKIFVGYLADAFWEVKLDGFPIPFISDADGIVIPEGDADAVNVSNGFTATDYVPGTDLGRDMVSLICLYAGIKILRNSLMEKSSRTRAKAGPVEFEQENSANLMTEMLKELQSVRQRLLFLRATDMDVSLVDAFSARSASSSSYSGYLYDWYAGAFGSPRSDAYYDTGIA